jgi:PPOX class probable F420-dependent enzyme
MSLPEAVLMSGPASRLRLVISSGVRLGEDEARARFGTVPVARLGTADGQGRPHLVVCTFAVDGDTVYTAVDQKPKSGRTLKRLHNVGENPAVTMLADHYSEDWETLWWVRADGRAEILTDPRQMAAPLRLLASRYWQYREAPPTGPVLAVTVERWTGWTGAPTTGPAATRTATAGEG